MHNLFTDLLEYVGNAGKVRNVWHQFRLVSNFYNPYLQEHGTYFMNQCLLNFSSQVSL